MRTTMQTVHRNILTNLNNLNFDMEVINGQISSMQQMSKLSDNPIHLVSALSMRTTLAEINQYQENLVYGNNMISASESSLTQIKSLVMRAKVLALQNINGAVVQENRLNTASEIRNIFEQSIILANTQVDGKYIFGGYRTAGYTEEETAPFVADLADGHLINSKNFSTLSQGLTGRLDNSANLMDGDLLINGESLGDSIDLTNPAYMDNGRNMGGAAKLASVINAKVAGFGGKAVTASLTTQYAGVTASGNTSGAPQTISFDLNNVNISVIVPNLATAGDAAALIATAVNSVRDQTGIKAEVGDGVSNGGPADSVILSNVLAGDEGTITIANLNEPVPAPGNAASGLSNGSYAIALDPNQNTGEVTLSSPESFALSSPNNPGDDSILSLLGLAGGGKGFADDPADGSLVYGHRLADGDLKINGYTVGTATDDGLSSIFSDSSAAAKATAINAISDDSGVTAVITPAYKIAAGSVEAGTLDVNDLVINGVNIFDATTTILIQDSDNTVLDAINGKIGQTGIAASRDLNGILVLKAIDGRNLQVRATAVGEGLLNLNGGSPAAPQDQVYFGALQLKSDRTFILETTPTSINRYEPGLEAIGLAGGVVQTGEPTDQEDDGKLSVLSIQKRDGNVRYNGDRENNVEIKVGKRNTLAVSKNGQAAVVDTGLFTVLKDLEDNLRAINYTSAVGIHQATDVTKPLNSGETGLPGEDRFSSGSFTVTVTDHAQYPPQDFAMTIEVNAEVDSLTGVAAKINGVPGMYSYWNSEGRIEIGTTDQERYTYTLTDHTSNFLEVAGITQVDMQIQGLDQSLQGLDDLLNSLTSQISDFGARVNRIQVQESIFTNLELSVQESLSEKQDTDIVEAMMEIKKKEVAYQAALSAAAKTMQLSLVNYL